MRAAAPPRLESLLRAMVATIREPDAPVRHEAHPNAYFANRGLEPRDQAALAAVPPKAMFAYRALVRATLRSAITQEIPRTVALLGSRFDLDLERYFAASMPTSHYLRDVAFEFVEAAKPGWSAPAEQGVPPVPAFIYDLARHELLDFEVAASPKNRRHGSLEENSTAKSTPVFEPTLNLERGVVFDGSVRLARYDYPVHTIGTDVAIPPQTTWLLVYRDAEFEIRHLELTPLAAAITQALLDGIPLGRAIAMACDRLHATLSPVTLEGAAKLLADYAERGVLLGSLPLATPGDHEVGSQ